MNILLFIMLAVFPLFSVNHYFNLTLAKYWFYSVVALAIFFMGVYGSICKSIDKNHKIVKPDIKIWFSKMSKLDSFVFLYVISAVVSFLLSDWKLPSFTGSCGSYTGLLFIFITAGMYYAITRHAKLTNWIKYCFPALLSITGLMAMLQVCGFNVLHFSDGIADSQRQIFISTLGNINVFGMFVCIYMPICIYMFCKFHEKCSVLYGVGTFFGFIGLLASNSDGCYLGIGACMTVMLILVLSDIKALFKYGISVALWAASLLLWNFVKVLFKEKMWNQNATNTFFMSFHVILTISIAAIVIIAFSLFLQKQSKIPPKILKKFVIAAAGVLLISTVLLCIWATWIEPTKELSGFFQYFRLDYSWGSNRGYAWHWAILMFINGSLKIKLFGAGPDTAYLMYISNYKNEMDANLPYYFKSPHNEYLNYLITVGLVGLFAYMAIVITAVKKSFSRIKEDEFFGAIALGILIYSIASFVNISQIITMPYIFILISLAGIKPAKQNNK